MSRWLRRQGDGGQAAPLVPFVLIVVVFVVLAVLVNIGGTDRQTRSILQVAQGYADAWRTGSLTGIAFDRLSNPEVGAGDAERIDANVKWIVHDLDGTGTLRPRSVEVLRDSAHSVRRLKDPAGDDLPLAEAWLRVTWRLAPSGLLQTGRDWVYDVKVTEHLDGGVWRVVWTPQTVHPAIRHGLVLRLSRSLPPRASVLGARDTVLPPDGRQNLGRAVLGSIVTKATYEQAQLAALRARPGDTVGVTGLQEIYDERLAGEAQIVVRAERVQGYTAVQAPQDPLFRSGPTTPSPIKVTLDPTVQAQAESAVRTVGGPATLVVVRPSTGEVLAVANTTTDVDYGLSAQQPPGPAFGLASGLALLRSGYALTSRTDCSAPYTAPGGQVFRNVEGPGIAGVTLGAAIEGGCVTALARASAGVEPRTLQRAAYDLGLAAPRDDYAGAPGALVLGDQLGTPAFHGQVPLTDDPNIRAENLTGEGTVLTSPLALARAAATVQSGTRRALRLIVQPTPQRADQPAELPGPELAALQQIMALGVTEGGGSAHALAGIGGVLPHAMAGTAGYGTGPQTTRQAWAMGYRGDMAFSVLVPNTPTGQGTTPALDVAAGFLKQAA